MDEARHRHDHPLREAPPFPTEVTFKAIYKNRPYLEETICTILAESELDAALDSRLSRNGKFISFTVSAEFSSESHLNSVCDALASLAGFTAMF